MSMPWTCDALLPRDERYASLKFRRVAGRCSDLQWADAAELVAFVQCVGLVAARWIFQWDAVSFRYVKMLVEGMAHDVDVVGMVEANRAAMTVDDGLGCLQAMKDGGWKQGWAPPVVRMALLELRDRGVSMGKIGDQLGLTRDQVRNICGGVRAGRCDGRRGRAASLLAVG